MERNALTGGQAGGRRRVPLLLRVRGGVCFNPRPRTIGCPPRPMERFFFAEGGTGMFGLMIISKLVEEGERRGWIR